MKYQEIVELRNSKLAEAEKIYADAGGNMNEEQGTAFDAVMAEVNALEKRGKQTKSLEDAKAHSQESAGRVYNPTQADVDLPKETRSRYSLMNVIRAQDQGKELRGLEREVHDELRKLNPESNPKGYLVPHMGSWGGQSGIQTRGLLSAATGSGAVATHTDADNFIDLLKNKLVVKEMGATVLSGLRGNVSIPKQTQGSTAYWISGDGGDAITVSNQVIGQVALTPTTLGAFTDISRKFLNQSSIDAESWTTNELMSTLAVELDRTVINGSDSTADDEPRGILSNDDVPTIACTDGTAAGQPTWGLIVNHQKSVASYNADRGSLAYLTSPNGMGKLKQTVKVSGHPVYLWGDDNRMNGFPAFYTSNFPTDLVDGATEDLSGLIYGDWSQVIIALFSALDVYVDRSVGGAYGTTRVYVYQDCDIKLRNPKSFSKTLDMIVV